MTPIKLSELEAKAREASDYTKYTSVHTLFGDSGHWSTLGLPHHSLMTNYFKLSDAIYIQSANPLTISRLCKALRIAVGALNAAHQDDSWIVSEDTLTKINKLVEL